MTVNHQLTLSDSNMNGYVFVGYIFRLFSSVDVMFVLCLVEEIQCFINMQIDQLKVFIGGIMDKKCSRKGFRR